MFCLTLFVISKSSALVEFEEGGSTPKRTLHFYSTEVKKYTEAICKNKQQD